MALVTCPECWREVSDRAAACPGCGHPVAARGAVPAAAAATVAAAASGEAWSAPGGPPEEDLAVQCERCRQGRAKLIRDAGRDLSWLAKAGCVFVVGAILTNLVPEAWQGLVALPTLLLTIVFSVFAIKRQDAFLCTSCGWHSYVMMARPPRAG